MKDSSQTLHIMDIGKKIMILRKEKKWSQNDLAQKAEVSREIISRYERSDVMPSVEVAKKIADAFEVSLDYLVGEGINSKFDKRTVKRLNDIEFLEENKKNTLFDLMDTYIRDAKTGQAYANR